MADTTLESRARALAQDLSRDHAEVYVDRLLAFAREERARALEEAAEEADTLGVEDWLRQKAEGARRG